MKTRKPAFAGSWYPAQAAECEQQIHSFLHGDRFRAETGGNVIGGIVPHAGWFFSGELACNVIASVRGADTSPQPDVIVVFGMHLPPGSPPFIMAEGSWDTPFGEIPIAGDIGKKLTESFRFNIETPTRFTPDNTIELQLPFIRYFFDRARLLPIGAPPSDMAMDLAQAVVDTAASLSLSIKVIGSTDLTHYGLNFGFTPAGTGKDAYEWVRDTNDRRIIDRMLDMDSAGVIEDGLTHQNGCCAGAAAAAIAAVKHLGAQKAALLGYSSSYEKTPGSSFVGYAGIIYE